MKLAVLFCALCTTALPAFAEDDPDASPKDADPDASAVPDPSADPVEPNPNIQPPDETPPSETPPDEQPGYTFPVWEPHVRLDYVFTPSAYADRINAVEVRKTPEATRSASDHFPLLVEIEER